MGAPAAVSGRKYFMKQFFGRIFYGRNGIDHLGIFTWCLTAGFFVATMISHSVIVYFIGVALLAWSVFRMLSTKTDRRYLENQKFDQFFYRIRYFFTDTKAAMADAGRRREERKARSQAERNARQARAAQERERRKEEAEQRKIYAYYKCPSCGQRLRVPKGRGKIEIRCPRCSTTFVKKT